MAPDPPVAPRGPRRPLALTIGAVLAAASAFLLPAADAELPDGAFAWQLFAVGAAVGGALWGYRSTRTAARAGAGAGSRRSVRILAGVAVLLAFVWVGGVALLWLIWPR